MQQYNTAKDGKGHQVIIFSSCLLESILAPNTKSFPVVYNCRGKDRLKIRGAAHDWKIARSITTQAKQLQYSLNSAQKLIVGQN